MFPTYVWPVARENGRRTPVISNPFNAGKHNGADIVYRLETGETPNNLPATTKMFSMPTGINVLASASGIIDRAGYSQSGGYYVVINHGSNYRTFYTHLSSLNVKAKDHVKTGQKLGIVGDSPSTAYDIRHLHFEIWYGNSPIVHKDPAYYLNSATYVNQRTSGSFLYATIFLSVVGVGIYLAAR